MRLLHRNHASDPSRDFLAIEGLAVSELRALIDRAERLLPAAMGEAQAEERLRGRVVANIFFEDSTRTRVSFEVAAKRLGADVVNLGASGSSASKGETLVDTARNIEAMGVDALVIRTSISGGAALVAGQVRCPVINAGDGRHEHPTQGLLDCLTIRRALGGIQGATVAIVGDIANSRVARSALHALTTLGATVRLIGPPTLLPRSFAAVATHADRVQIAHDLDSNLRDLDVIMMLRVQLERAAGGGIASDYRLHYGLTRERATHLPAACIVMHPGPVNRGVEVDDDVADDGRRSQILRQVTHGVAVRMAVLAASIKT